MPSCHREPERSAMTAARLQSCEDSLLRRPEASLAAAVPPRHASGARMARHAGVSTRGRELYVRNQARYFRRPSERMSWR